jgi:hypothetical protein
MEAGKRRTPRVKAMGFIGGYLIVIFVGAAVAYDASSPGIVAG